MYQKRLYPDLDLNEYFENPEYQLLELGNLVVKEGKLIAADPLFSLPYGGTAPFVQKALPGNYPVTLSVFSHADYGDRYLAAKITFSEHRAEAFQLALKPGERVADLAADEIFGFPVETGLGSFCDNGTQKLFQAFCEEWYRKNPGKNIYDDYFAAIFAKSYQKHPKFQRKDGDWINWTLPGKQENLIMFNSGFGDGVYPAYWGYDPDGKSCCLIIQFISPAELEE